MYRPNYLKDKEVRVFKDKLGISIKGMEVFNMPNKKEPTRKVALQLAEGLAACLMGFVRKTAFSGTPNFNFSVYGELELAAYAGSHTADFTDVKNAVSSLCHVCGANFGDKKVFTEIPSTSSVQSSTNTGKTELSVFVSALLSAIVEYRNGNPDAARFLEDYQKVLDQLNAFNALPLANVIGGASNAPAAFSFQLKVAAESAYEWLAYGGEAERTGAPSGVFDWEVERQANAVLPGYNPAQDFASMLTDADEFRDFVATRKLPKERAATSQATAAGNSTAAPTGVATIAAAGTSSRNRQTNRTAATGAAPVVPSKPLRPNLPAYVSGIIDSTRIRMPRGGAYSVLLKGPAGTGKTWAVFNSDKMPTNRVGVSSEVDAPLLLGEFNRDEDGAWKPFLGSIAKVARTAMLEAMLVQFKRGRQLVWKEFEKYSHPLVKTLKILQSDPNDTEARRELDELANPTAPKSWAIINDAYFALEAPSVGPVRRLFLDEIWDSAGNKEVTTVLKFLMEDERRVILSRSGAGWCDLFAYNIHLVAAGNPDEAMATGIGLSRAIQSRFGFTYGVGYCNEAEEIKRTISGATTRQQPIIKPVGLELETSNYEPPVMPALNPSEKVAKASVAFGKWTRDEFKAGSLGELLDPRGVDQIAYATAYLHQEFEITLKDAFLAAVESVVDRLCEMDDLGLPLESQKKTVTQKAGSLGIGL